MCEASVSSLEFFSNLLSLTHVCFDGSGALGENTNVIQTNERELITLRQLVRLRVSVGFVLYAACS